MMRYAPVVLFLLVPILGCGGPERPADLPKLVPVTVKVNYNGAPMAGATVVLNPSDHKWTAMGKTDASGQTKLRTNSMWDGAAPGEYKVTIIALPTELGPDKTPPKNQLPAKYASVDTTDQSATITAGSPATLTFDLQ